MSLHSVRASAPLCARLCAEASCSRALASSATPSNQSFAVPFGAERALLAAAVRACALRPRCAALVRAGCFPDWEAAFAHCKSRRPCVKLNGKMRAALTAWAEAYGKKRG